MAQCMRAHGLIKSRLLDWFRAREGTGRQMKLDMCKAEGTWAGIRLNNGIPPTSLLVDIPGTLLIIRY